MAITRLRGHEIMSDRYKYDFRLCKFSEGWAQLDSRQDASYYGQWANPLTLRLQSYCEGDTNATVCDTEADFVTALSECINWNKEAGYWIGIDAGKDGPIVEAFTRMGFAGELH
jgi:hypothetical protein